MAVTGWDLLRELRHAGQRPAAPVVVTTDPAVVARKRGDGSLVVLHVAGTPMPVELLDGLDVRFAFTRCDLAGRVYALMAERGVRPASATVWCHCAQQSHAAAFACESIARLGAWPQEASRAA